MSKIKQLFCEDDRGLTGNSGFISPGLHIARNYSCNGLVFVDTGDSWDRMTNAEAEKSGLEIIKCSVCGKNATSLDHYYPHYIDRNRCDDCLDKKTF